MQSSLFSKVGDWRTEALANLIFYYSILNNYQIKNIIIFIEIICMKNKENSNEKTPTQNKYKVAPKVYFYRVIYLKIS